MTTYTPELGDRITALLAEFKLSSAAEQMTKRFVDAGCDQALVTLAEVLEVESQARRERRVDRLRRASRLPPAKTFDTLDATRVPRTVLIQTRELARGHFVDRADNVLLFGRPGVGKSHLACALGHALVGIGVSVLFIAAYQLVQQLLAARRDLSLPKALRTLDAYDVMILDDLGYVQQTPDEAEVLFTLMAERYERRSLVITSNLVFSEWDRIFKNPMTTAAAIDRLVHHATILEIDRDSIRAEEAKRRAEEARRRKDPRRTTTTATSTTEDNDTATTTPAAVLPQLAMLPECLTRMLPASGRIRRFPHPSKPRHSRRSRCTGQRSRTWRRSRVLEKAGTHATAELMTSAIRGKIVVRYSDTVLKGLCYCPQGGQCRRCAFLTGTFSSIARRRVCVPSSHVVLARICHCPPVGQ